LNHCIFSIPGVSSAEIFVIHVTRQATFQFHYQCYNNKEAFAKILYNPPDEQLQNNYEKGLRMENHQRLLPGDIGGTNTCLAIFPTKNNELKTMSDKHYSSTAYSSLEEIITEE